MVDLRRRPSGRRLVFRSRLSLKGALADSIVFKVNDIQGTLTSSVSAMLIGEDNMIELQAKVNTEREKDYKEYQNQTEELIKENTRLNEKIKALEEENAALKAATGTS